jgi:hypothetical protein
MGIGMAASMLPGRAGQVAGQATGAAFVAQALMMLPGPLKLVGAGLAATYGLIKVANFFRQKEIDAIEGVGRAANLTSGQLDKLGEVLGFTPLKSNLEMAKAAVPGLTPEQSKQVEETRKLLATDKDFKAFDVKKGLDGLGIHLGSVDQAEELIRTGQSMSSKRPEKFVPNAQILPVVTKARNPIRMPDLNDWDKDKVAAQLRKQGIEVPAGAGPDAQSRGCR